MESIRKSGILLHISSLPSKYGVGDFGIEAYHFIDHLSTATIKIWQILPLGPNGPGNSPYQAYSAYAGDPIYISPEKLIEWGLLNSADLLDEPGFSSTNIEFEKVTRWKSEIHKKAWQNFILEADQSFKMEYQSFLNEHNWWLSDYALYMACKKEFQGESWNKWEMKLIERDSETMTQYKWDLSSDYEFERFQQFLFFRQWFQLKSYANGKGIKILGDLPLYVSHDSSDVWSNQKIFLLDETGEPSFVGGVPPDYFSEDGQCWGNPVYNWKNLEKTNYQWWIARLYFNFHMFNLVRIDHFRGLESFWAIPANSENAKIGEWLPANGFELLTLLQNQLSELPIVAEDLGIITPEVEKLRNHFNLPGMKVLQFAFTSDETNELLPHNYHNRNVAYTGTHDNDTLLGWWRSVENEERKKISSYVNLKHGSIGERLIEWIWSSTAEIAIIPMQDLLGLGSEARMNIPGTATGNWHWRFQKRQVRKQQFEFIRRLNKTYNR
jgi:4-alpha-glucanotransferase